MAVQRGSRCVGRASDRRFEDLADFRVLLQGMRS